ncbi:hypothetical protein B566_EDAN009015 [Ephemera danica]|nr:hypothetical protein B566_EDAN009015 [Ephemera danica]
MQVPLLCALLCCMVWAQDPPPTVHIPNIGTIEGSTKTSRDGRRINSFQGIPYAEPPIGDFRFQPPMAKNWTGDDRVNASMHGLKCPQFDFTKIVPKPEESEDCLILSVYYPDDGIDNMPVMVFLHGGSYTIGSADRIAPEYLLDKDVVLVVPQYRLGPLEWVQTNIGYFKGDPTKVTLWGHSAGAGIVTTLMTSPLANQKNLFWAVIANSGSVMANWALDTEPVAHATSLAKLANCSGTVQDMGTCLTGISVYKLKAAFYAFTGLELTNTGKLISSAPCISRPDEPVDTKVLPENPALVMEKGNFAHVPLLSGSTRHDGMFVVDLLNNLILKPGNLTNDEFYMIYKFPQALVQFNGILDQTLTITDMMETKYFTHVTQTERSNFTALLPSAVDFSSVATFKSPGFHMIQLNSDHNTSFWYSFDYVGRYHVPGNGIDEDGLFSKGAVHSDDIIYLTPRVEVPVDFNDEELRLSKLMVNLWVNFATNLNPSEPLTPSTPEWPEYKRTSDQYLLIDQEYGAAIYYPGEYKAAINDVMSQQQADGAVSLHGVTVLTLLVMQLYLRWL